jgi:aspartate racemase
LRAFYFQETSREAAQGYVPQGYPGRLILFRTPHSAPQLHADWQSLAARGVGVYEVPGNHLDIIREPYVRTLAATLQACLAQAQAGEERYPTDGR